MTIIKKSILVMFLVVSPVSVFQGCQFNTPAGDAAEDEITDSIAPVPGNNGTITTGVVNSGSIVLNWTMAADNITSSSDLQYAVYQSSGNTLATVEGCEAATQVQAYTAGLLTKTVTGLSASTTYYFNVVVKDSAGNMALYATLQQATTGSGTGYIDTTPSFVEDFNSIDSSIWTVATWEEESITSVDRCYASGGILNLIFRYDTTISTGREKDRYLGAAIETKNTFLYGRWEARLKPSSVAGVLNSMYTIDWGGGSGTKQEIDIEFLTYQFGSGTGKVNYAVHAAGYQSSGAEITLGFNPSDDFHVFGYEITPDHISWIVDGEVKFTYTYSERPVTINSPYNLKFNVWTLQDWINGPPVANTNCVYQIDWVKFYPYESN